MGFGLIEYSGKSLYKGIAIGKILFIAKKNQQIKRIRIEDVNAEIVRFEEAKANTILELQVLYEKALKEIGEVNAQIFEVHIMMLDDDDYNDSIKNIITRQNVNAEYAVARTCDNFVEMFEGLDDDYMKARAADVKDISERMINVLSGVLVDGKLDEASIVVAEDLAPSETIQMDKNKLLAFVTKQGSTNSHTAILARNMQIPALIGVDIEEEWNGKFAIVDGIHGKIILEPDSELLDEYRKKQNEEIVKIKLLKDLVGKDTVTLSGRKVLLYANVGELGDLSAVLENDAAGIGLFRSEFIYLGATDFPTEEEQFHIYKQIAETMAGKRAIVRTFDIGADKKVDYFNLDKEENPAMGYRGIRICLTQTEIFRTQLRALYRASAFGNLAVMYPMIISMEEIKKIKTISTEIKAELKAEGITFNENMEEGIMIETPAAALISDLLAKEVDFFSIGTNDLTQYTLALDRQNSKLDIFYNPHHEAILRQIKLVADNAHNAGIWVGICGELGADPTLTEKFLEMGIDELSVSPGDILPIRKIVREIL